MALPPIPADEPGYKISDSLRRWLQLLAQALGGLTVTNTTITTTRTIIAETFEGALDGSHITGNLAYAQLPAGSGTWAASPSISGAVALGSTLDVTGLSTFGSHLVPSASEAYDLGSETKLWRKAFVSQMQATLFSKETQSLYGGWLAVTKNAGTFAAGVVPLATTVDFGQAMTANQFVLVRAVDRTGTISSEYMQVVSLSTGTTYNVTRDLAGTGAKDWPEGTPYAVRGVAGDGWVELNAFDTPRMSVFTQGSAYNNSVENIRIGHLTGMPASSSGIGAFFGDATTYLRWDGTTLETTGIVRNGQTAFATGTGYWLGLVTGTPKFSIGNATTKHALTFDGTDLTIAAKSTNVGTNGSIDGNVGLWSSTTAVLGATPSPNHSVSISSDKLRLLDNAAGSRVDIGGLTGDGRVNVVSDSFGLQMLQKKTLASAATYDFPNGSTPRGVLTIVIEEDNAAVQVLLRGGTGATVIMSDPVGIASITSGTASKLNVFWNAGSGTYRIENNRGASRTLEMQLFGTGII